MLASGNVNEVYQRFGNQAQFLVVYVREAHATDGWSKPNSQLADPRTQTQRDLVALQCCKELEFEFPALVDTMNDRTAVDWAAWPERIFVIGVDGRVAYAGEQGPWGFWPTERIRLQAAQKNAAKAKKAKTDKTDKTDKNDKNDKTDKNTAKGKNEYVPVRNYDGDSLEKFLARLLPSTAAEVVEPRVAEQGKPGN